MRVCVSNVLNHVLLTFLFMTTDHYQNRYPSSVLTESTNFTSPNVSTIVVGTRSYHLGIIICWHNMKQSRHHSIHLYLSHSFDIKIHY